MAWFLLLLHSAQAALSASAAYHSYNAITNLQQYESATQRAARVLSAADEQLQKTRKTHTAGAITLFASLASSTYLAYNALTSTSTRWQALIPILNGALAIGARAYIMDFWSEKRTVPVVEGYNKGIEHSNRLNDFLLWLSFAWVLSGVVTLVG